MKVFYLCWAYPSSFDLSIGSFFRNQVEGLVANGIEVDVVTPLPYVPKSLSTFKPSWKRYTRLPARERLFGVNIFRPHFLHFPNSVELGCCPWLMASSISKDISGSCNIVHSHGAYPYGKAGLIVSKRRQCKSALTVRGGDVNIYPYTGRLERKRFSTTILDHDVVMAVSEPLATRTLELTGRKPIHTPIGVDIARIRRDQCNSQEDNREIARVQLGLPLSSRIVLFVGTLIKEKGVSDLIEAIRVLRALDIFVVYLGEGPLKSVVKGQAKCVCVGSVSNADVLKYMQVCDVLVLPSYSEGLPNVIVEAGAVALPVIASAVGGIPTLLSNKAGILVSPGNITELVNALEYVFANPEEARATGLRLQERVFREYDSRNNAAQVASLYRNMA